MLSSEGEDDGVQSRQWTACDDRPVDSSIRQ